MTNLPETAPPALAGMAAEAIRALNHVTLNDTAAYETPGDISDTVWQLQLVAERFSQALVQAAAALTRHHAADGIRMDDPTRNLGTDVKAVLRALLDSQVRAQMLASELRLAAGPLSHMGAPWIDDEDQGDEEMLPAGEGSR